MRVTAASLNMTGTDQGLIAAILTLRPYSTQRIMKGCQLTVLWLRHDSAVRHQKCYVADQNVIG